jgi:hypothetical protein
MDPFEFFNQVKGKHIRLRTKGVIFIPFVFCENMMMGMQYLPNAEEKVQCYWGVGGCFETWELIQGKSPSEWNDTPAIAQVIDISKKSLP